MLLYSAAKGRRQAECPLALNVQFYVCGHKEEGRKYLIFAFSSLFSQSLLDRARKLFSPLFQEAGRSPGVPRKRTTLSRSVLMPVVPPCG